MLARCLRTFSFLGLLSLIPACSGGSTAMYTVGGSVAGLTTGSIVIQINGGSPMTLTANGPFVWPTMLASGTAFTVTIVSAPPGYSTTIQNGTGTITGHVNNIALILALDTFTVGGTVSGLSGTLVLRNNGGNDLTITADGPFTFSTSLPSTATYAVTVFSEPVGQTCTITNSSGTITNENITNVSITCITKYSVGGSVTGLSGGTLVLQNNGANDLSVSADGPFTFPTTVANGTAYAVTVKSGPPTQSCTVTNGSGTVSGANVTNVAVTCSNKAWNDPGSLSGNISPDGQSATEVATAIDETGRVIVAWTQSDGTFTQIFKSEYRNAAWTHPSALTDNISPDGQNASKPAVAMDANGNAIIVWQQSDGTNVQTFKSEYRSGAWTHPSSLTDNISPDGQDTANPRVAMDDNGNAIIIWQQRDGTNIATFKSEYRSGAWTHPSSLTDNISPDTTSVADPQVAMADNGVAVIVWVQWDGSNDRAYKSEYRSGAWTHPSSLTDNFGPAGANASAAQVALDDNGNAVIVWQQSDTTNEAVFKSEYRSGAWTHPSSASDNISPDTTDAIRPQVALDNNGNAIIVWHQSNGTVLQIYKSEYRSGTWTHPSGLGDDISPAGQAAVRPFVAMDDNGSAVIVWYQHDGGNQQTFRSQYRSGTWTHPSSLTDNYSPDGQDATAPRVALSANGNAVIVWQQSDGSNSQTFVSEYR